MAQITYLQSIRLKCKRKIFNSVTNRQKNMHLYRQKREVCTLPPMTAPNSRLRGQRKEEAHRQNISPYRPLPDSPLAVKVKQERVDLGQMNARLLQKTICIFAEQTFNILITEYNINQIIKNKMKKNYIIYKLVLLLVFPIILSCETEEYNPDLSNSDEFQTKSLPNLNNADRRYIAKYFAMTLALNNSAVSELNNAIHIAYQYGVDEHIFVYDILYQSYSKFLGNSVSLNNIRNVVLSSNLINLCDVANTQYLHNLLFYWPYHDDWDGITMPYVIFEPMLTNSPYVTGYRAIDKVVDSAQFDVSDMDNSKDQFIIIKEAELPYTIYPSFKDGIFTNNGITWTRRTNVTDEEGETCYEDMSVQDKDTLVEASVLYFKSDGNQYDSKIFGGGTEFFFTFATANIDSTGNVQRFLYEMTRKEIKKR